MKIEDVKKVLILGAGTMGQQIGFQCALHGYDVVLYDITEDVFENALTRIRKMASGMAGRGKITREQAQNALMRITTTTDPEEAAREADIISESVPEDPQLKGRVFARFNKLCPPRTIFTTNTSTLVPSMFAKETGRPARFTAFHFHDIRTNNVVDIMPHPGTSPETVDLIKDFAESIGQIAIVLHKEQNGYVFNTMLTKWFEAALTLAANGVASVEDIDRSWMGVMNAPTGPFGIMDQIGLSTVWIISEYWANENNDPQAKINADFVKRYVDKELLGAKSGQGFYTYPDASYRRPGFLK
ncbi:MAG: 3-hydroxyacyl-CoA dehydrogenase [Deltaproteobacteria bacterium]|nr:3-hydroxyacyl-CoA dehydrogenase [Deltaproteobacteria bacterium]